MLRNVRLEARLIDDLLDFSRIISGKLELHREPLDLHALIRGVVDICAEDIAAGAHVVTLELDSPRAMVLGDSARLQQVFWNVVKNAVKFTPAGGRILIRPTWWPTTRSRWQVADNGRRDRNGQPHAHFQRVRAGRAADDGQFGGLGLGLAITKAFVELHGGTVRAASAGAGAGTQIHIRLPLLGQENDVALPAPGPPCRPPTRWLRRRSWWWTTMPTR